MLPGRGALSPRTRHRQCIARQPVPQVHVNTQDEIAALPATAVAGFLKVDARPLKQALSTWVTKWIYVFTLYLQNKVRKVLQRGQRNRSYDMCSWQTAVMFWYVAAHAQRKTTLHCSASRWSHAVICTSLHDVCHEGLILVSALRRLQVVNAVAEVFTFVSRASDVLGQPVGTELGADTPRFMLEQVQRC